MPETLPAVVDTTSAFTLFPTASALARHISQTDFVPRALRGKPEAVTACILAGHELGIGPMQSLSKIHVIDGRPSMAAELQRAVIIRNGHDLWIEESTNTRCVLGTRRAGSSRDQMFTYTVDDAKQAGLAGKDNWRKYPRAMLLARATGEMARAVYPDILAGISYTSEELTDGDFVDGEDRPTATKAAPAAKRTAKASRAATRPAQPRPIPEPDEPPLPGEDGYDDETGPQMTGPQMIAMKFGGHGITERDERIEIISRIVDREISSSKELTNDEIATVLETLEDDDAFEKFAYAETINDDDHQDDEQTSPIERPADSAGWRALLKMHGKRIVDALKVTGTTTLDNLGDDEAEALLIWITREEDNT